jgi:diguanylate cyclase
MKYHDSVAKSREYLGSVLSLMSRQPAAMDPVSYAVWYEYVAGLNPSLSLAIDGRLSASGSLDDQATGELFRLHVADADPQVLQELSESLQKVLLDMSGSVAQAGDQAGVFGAALEQWAADQVSSSPGRLKGVDSLLGLTRNMQGSIATLRGSLDASRAEIDQLRLEVGKAREDALSDGLTGLTNRRGFDSDLAACLSVAGPAQAGPSLLMADIDHFKQVNDTYGHVFGDKVIRAVAQILKNSVQGRDKAARFGGEEFVVLLPDTPIEGARQLAETIRAMVEKIRIKRTADSWAPANISISLGVAGFRTGDSSAEFIARADAALYVSKGGGRNRVTVAPA